MKYSTTLTPSTLAAAREAMHLSRHSLAERLGVDYQTARRWEQPGVRIPAMAEVALRTVQRERAEELADLSHRVREMRAQVLTPAAIARTRQELNLTTADLAARMGVAEATVRKWEQPGMKLTRLQELAFYTVVQQILEEKEVKG